MYDLMSVEQAEAGLMGFSEKRGSQYGSISSICEYIGENLITMCELPD